MPTRVNKVSQYHLSLSCAQVADVTFPKGRLSNFQQHSDEVHPALIAENIPPCAHTASIGNPHFQVFAETLRAGDMGESRTADTFKGLGIEPGLGTTTPRRDADGSCKD